MKDFNIDGKVQRVFVLTETTDRVVYIPLKDLHRVDYERLEGFDKEEGELMKVLSRSTLDNGMNALTQFESLIQIMDLTPNGDGVRVRKPSETINVSGSAQVTKDPNELLMTLLTKLTEVATAPAPAPVEAAPAPAPVAPKPAAKRTASAKK